MVEEGLMTAGTAALAAAHKRKVEAEIFLLYNRELSIELRDAQVETLKEAEEIGLGIRVLNNRRMGFAYSSDLSPAAVNDMVDKAISISDCMPPDDYQGLQEPSSHYSQVTCFDQEIVATGWEEKIELARAGEKAARSFDKRIRLVEKSAYEDSHSVTVIMNSRGLQVSHSQNLAGIHIALVAQEEKDSQTGFAVAARRKIADLNPQQLGEEAAHRAVRSLQAGSLDSQNLPCIMEPYIAARFMGLLLPSLYGDAVLKGKSRWSDKIGQSVAAPLLQISDDATLKDGLASAPFDGEGTPTQKNILIQDGILQSYLYDNYSGRKAKQASTGSARRGSFRSLPAIGSSNLIISPGSLSPEQMIADIDSGLLITELMGMHTANPISGDFSLGAGGILIQAGKLTRPVRGLTIAGNLHQLLQNIDALGSDLEFHGTKAAPSIRFNHLSIGGN